MLEDPGFVWLVLFSLLTYPLRFKILVILTFLGTIPLLCTKIYIASTYIINEMYVEKLE
jgi:hypothetical protein